MQFNVFTRASAAWVLGVVGSFTIVPATALAAVPTVTSFAPTSGPIGASIVINGTNLTAPTKVTFDGTASTFIANSATQVTATVPAAGPGQIAVTTAGGTGTSAAAFTVTPSAQLAPNIGHPGLAVTVTAAGFGAYTPVDAFVDTTDVALLVSNANGVISTTVTMPVSAQPGTHWITLAERSNQLAAQKPFTVSTNWLQGGFAAADNALNPFENTLDTTSASDLDTLWAENFDEFSNPSPYVEVNGTVILGDESGGIHAYSSTGTLLWHQTEGAFPGFQSNGPASNGTLVFFGSGSSVYAFKAACRTDGGLCAPTWTKTIASTVTATLTVYDNELYVPAADGQIYPLNPTTGVLGAPFFALDNTDGAITTAVAFRADGSYYYGTSEKLHAGFSYGAGVSSWSALVSAPAVASGAAYFATADGAVHKFSSWDTASLGTSCGSVAKPVVSGNAVYAAGCAQIGAYSTSTGALLWSVPTNSAAGLALANGVLYTCTQGALFAYVASYGGLLWSGGPCTDAPLVVNGRVYAAQGSLSAYGIPSLNPDPAVARPELSELKPNLRLPAQKTADTAE